MSPKLQRNLIAVVLVVASLGIGYGLRSAFPPCEVITTPVVIDEALWRAMISGPPMAVVFAVIAAATAFTPAILSTRIARENAAREQWWNRAEWALGLASSSDPATAARASRVRLRIAMRGANRSVSHHPEGLSGRACGASPYLES